MLNKLAIGISKIPKKFYGIILAIGNIFALCWLSIVHYNITNTEILIFGSCCLIVTGGLMLLYELCVRYAARHKN
jgi:uncharacterized membrane protein YdjX (TVP38/TMEM64 family)